MLEEHNKNPKLGIILEKMGVITKDDIDFSVNVCADNKQQLGEYLVTTGKVTEHELAQALSEQFNLQLISARDTNPTVEALKLLPFSLAEQNCVLPFSIIDGVLQMVVYDPAKVIYNNEIMKEINCKYKLFVSTEVQIIKSIREAYKSNGLISENELGRPSLSPKHTGVKQRKAVTVGKKNSIEQLVNQIIEEAVAHKASDIHLEPQEELFQIRKRIDGVLIKGGTQPISSYPGVVSRIKLLAGIDISEKRIPQDGRFYFDYKSRRIDLRVSTLPTIKGEKIVLRILDKLNINMDFKQLGLGAENIKALRLILEKSYGLFLLTGPTGSGKTTSMYAMLNHINSTKKNIITVEDPVEYEFKLINQVQANPKLDFTFAKALKHILRQDPDVIMIGEIRDHQTAKIAVQAAMTGHLVISTVHSNDAVSAATRLIDLGIEPFLVSSSLIGVMAQRLIRKLCNFCKKKVEPVGEGDPSLEQVTYYYSEGCDRCFSSGYSGREGVFELLQINDVMRRSISENISSFDLQVLAEKSDFIAIKDEGRKKAIEGVTTEEEINRILS